MINPRIVQTWHEKFTDRARGTKFYRTGFELPGHAKFSRRKFKTASEAEDYGLKVLLRWFRLYDASITLSTGAAVLAMAKSETLPVPEQGPRAVVAEV